MSDGRPVVALTGATGWIGRIVARRLEEAGFSVRPISRRAGSAGDGARLLPPPDAAPDAFRAMLAGVDHVVHVAGLSNTDRRTSEAAYMDANARLAGQVAEAAAATVAGRFVLFSSLRAVVGRGFVGEVGEHTPPRPADAYGRSKLEGERACRAAYQVREPGSLVALRPAPVYGEGMRGRLAAMMRLADTALPLPLGGTGGRRSLASGEALGGAVPHLLRLSDPPAEAYIVSDVEPLTAAEIIAAFREGLGRLRRIFGAPPGLLRAASAAFGGRDALAGLFGDQICDPSALRATGWRPVIDSRPELTALATRLGRAPAAAAGGVSGR